MKKRFSYLMTLLCLLLCGASNSWAGDVYTVTFDNEMVQTPESSEFFKLTDSGTNYNPKYTCKYNGNTISSPIKMQGGTTISFTSAAKATVTIVQSTKTYGDRNIKFDDTEQKTGITCDAGDENNVNVKVYTLTDVEAGTHSITRTSELGIAFISVEYTGSVMTKLDAPTISYEGASGKVTITDGTNVKYTTDGTDPSESNGTVYADPFIVEDGTTVKAASIGDGTTTLNSDVETVQVLKSGVTIATPTATSYNGTIVLACATAATTLKYSVNGGEEKTYTKPFTLLENGTVNVTASREGSESVNTSVNVTAVSKGLANKTIYMGIGSFTSDNANKLEAQVGDGAEGCTLQITGNLGKNLSSGIWKITTPSDETRTSIKLSNGAQNTLTLPAGINATRITFYSFINTGTRTCGWKEVAGVDYTDYAEYAMATPNPGADTNDADIRTYPVDNANTITFTNAGEQLCFIIAVDVIDPSIPQPATISAGGYTTFCPLYSDVTIPAGVTAYTAAMNDAKDAVVLTEVASGKLPKGCGVVLGGTAGETYKFEPTTEAAALAAGNQMVGATADIDDLKNVYVLGVKDGSCLFGTWSGTTFPAGKAYLNYSPSLVGAPSIGIVFNDEATAISTLANEQTKNVQGYNLAGQKVGNNFRGIVIVNGKKTIIK